MIGQLCILASLLPYQGRGDEADLGLIATKMPCYKLFQPRTKVPVILWILLAPRGRARAPSEADEGPVQPPSPSLSAFLGIDSMQF